MDPNRLKTIPIFSHLSDEEAKRLAAFADRDERGRRADPDEAGRLLHRADRDRGGDRRRHSERGEDRLAEGRRPDRRDGPARARAAQCRRDRDLADARDEADPLGDPADVRRDARPDQGDRREAPAGRASRIRPTEAAARQRPWQAQGANATPRPRLPAGARFREITHTESAQGQRTGQVGGTGVRRSTDDASRSSPGCPPRACAAGARRERCRLDASRLGRRRHGQREHSRRGS